MTTTELANEIGNIERQRLRSLVEVRLEDADAFHAPDFELVHPSPAESGPRSITSRASHRGTSTTDVSNQYRTSR